MSTQVPSDVVILTSVPGNKSRLLFLQSVLPPDWTHVMSSLTIVQHKETLHIVSLPCHCSLTTLQSTSNNQLKLPNFQTQRCCSPPPSAEAPLPLEPLPADHSSSQHDNFRHTPIDEQRTDSRAKMKSARKAESTPKRAETEPHREL